MKFNCANVTGFTCNEEHIFIKSARNGRSLYYMRNTKRLPIKFNVIAGDWETENKLTRLPKPLFYVCPELHAPTVKREYKKFVYEVGENENKCTIDFKNPNWAHVFIDNEIDEQEIPFQVFVLFHENGHFKYGGMKKESPTYYDNEYYCDCYAAKKMLQKGFNPSQCMFAIELCLSEADEAAKRKDRLFNWLKQVKTI